MNKGLTKDNMLRAFPYALSRDCKEHPDFENDVTELTSARIKEIYSHCLDSNDFL